MKINKYTFFCLLFCLPFLARAQDIFLKTYDHKKLEGQTLKVYFETGLVSISALKPNIIKVDFLKNDTDSGSELLNEEKVYVRVTQNLDDIFFQTDSLLIIINKINFSIKFEKRNEDIYLINDIVMEKMKKGYLHFSILNAETGVEEKIKIRKSCLISNELGFGIFYKGFKKPFFISSNEGVYNGMVRVKNLSYLFIADKPICLTTQY